MQRGSALWCALLILASCGCSAGREVPPSIPAGASLEQVGTAPRPDRAEGDNDGAPHLAGIERRIIYKAEINLVVCDFADTETAVSRLVREHGGYLADAHINRTAGEQRSGRWQARIPVDRFESFLAAASKMGVPESRQQTARDVSEEYVDLEARTANQKRLEQRILKLLEDSEADIKEVIEVERELARVRGEIEQTEGRLRYLTNRTELATVTIVAREQRDYVPPQAPTFLARVRQAWSGSLLSLRRLGEHMAVAAVFAFPWLVILFVVIAPSLWCVRRYKYPAGKTARGDQPQSPDLPDQADG